METLIVHIGTHKTGSTAIQKLLTENRQLLSASGFQYPEIGFDYYGHHELQAALERQSADELTPMAKALNALDGNVIVSSENFSRSTAAGIQRLADLVDARNVRIVCYQRNLLDMVHVWWQEMVKHGSTKTLLAFYAECLTRPKAHHIMAPKTVIDRWASAFGREAITIYLYDEIENVARQFFNDVLGIKNVDMTDTLGVNKSFDTPTTELIRCLNSRGIRGVRAVLEEAGAKALRDKMRQASAGRMDELPIDFDCFIFSRLESEFRSAWQDRIAGYDGKSPLFRKRASALRYLDSSFWFENEELSAQIRNYAKELIEQKTRTGESHLLWKVPR